MAQFLNYIDHLQEAEGGYVFNKKDPGGHTNKGVTLRIFKAVYGAQQTVEDLKRITTDQVHKIYRSLFWDVVKGDKIQSQPVANTIFDFAVNAAPSKAIKLVQYLLNKTTAAKLVVNGVMNERTLQVLNGVNSERFFGNYNNLRKVYYTFRAAKLPTSHPDYRFISTLTKPKKSQSTFLEGWKNRVDKIGSLFKNLFAEEKKNSTGSGRSPQYG